MAAIDETHDAGLTSWVASANVADTDFPIQNLPFGRFRPVAPGGPGVALRVGVAIGDEVLDLSLAASAPGWPAEVQPLLAQLASGDLNGFMGLGPAPHRALRLALSRALRAGSPMQAALSGALRPQSQAGMALPCEIGDYTDFYTGIHHATTVGTLFRPDQPLLPNYKWVPIGYHGRSSSIVVSGTPVRRPRGQVKGPDHAEPILSPSRRLDHELELGAVIGRGNALGTSIGLDEAEDHLFGIVLLNDWSARDVQAWEYQPLGPFLAKNFASTVSPWIVTMEALAPFRAPFVRAAEDPRPLPYLDAAGNRAAGQLDLVLEVQIQTAAMRAAGLPPHRLSTSRTLQAAYWTFAQLVTHHSVGGCNLRSGDLLGSGTLSGPAPDQGGSILELSAGGKRALELPGGETRTFLQDGDTVILRAWGERPGARRIGLGSCSGTVLAAA
ncbi:fumarylacetoacetase [Leptothrix discophora]|uniref:fumarylacetoacetase n=1 Tax=Leptothrix discophora TaxID=89 RepID=A0ABT9G8L4_LEPDI|nr:fumarylacetoacetase [Leptothrix discophora]MDP4302832.1 fumarylacetoacetase [Leptothrix discophora]